MVRRKIPRQPAMRRRSRRRGSALRGQVRGVKKLWRNRGGKISKFLAAPIFLWILGVGVILVGIVWVLRNTFFSEEFVVESVVFSSGSLAQHQDLALYREIESALSGQQGYFFRLWGAGAELEKIQQEFPILAGWELTPLLDGRLFVDLEFRPGNLAFRGRDEDGERFRIAVAGEPVRVHAESVLLEGVPVFDLAPYLSGQQFLSGIFWAHEEEELLRARSFLSGEFSMGMEVTFFPGAERVRVEAADGKQYFFRLGEDFAQQVEKFRRLKQWSGWTEFRVMDFGLDDPRGVVVRRSFLDF